MLRQRPFAGERNEDGSRTLWYEPSPEVECTCNAKPSEAHKPLCLQAPRLRQVPPRFGAGCRSREEHFRDVARTIALTDIAERCDIAREAFERREARERFNPLAVKLGGALGKK